MASRVRSIVASGAIALLVLASAASAAVAATPAQTGGYTFGDDYCWQQPNSNVQYCFEQDGLLQFVQTPDGREMATIAWRQTTRIYHGAQLVGESREVSIDKSLWEEGGLTTFQTVSHTNSRFGEVKCVLTTVLKMVDYEIEVDHWNAPDCS